MNNVEFKVILSNMKKYTVCCVYYEAICRPCKWRLHACSCNRLGGTWNVSSARNMAEEQSGSRRSRGRKEAVAVEVAYSPPPTTLHPNTISSLRGHYRAAHPDQGTTLVPYSHMLMVHDWPITCPRFKAAIGLAGLECVTWLLCTQPDHHLLIALFERWCPQTNTFHLVVGEMTVTLDVAMLMGLQVDGNAVIGPSVVGMGR